MAIHRAAILANPATSHAGKVLLVTFNRTLVAYLDYWRPPALRDVTIENYHAFARGYLASRGQLGPDSICSAEEMESLVPRPSARSQGEGDPKHAGVLEKSLQFFVDEIRFLARYGLKGVHSLRPVRPRSRISARPGPRCSTCATNT